MFLVIFLALGYEGDAFRFLAIFFFRPSNPVDLFSFEANSSYTKAGCVGLNIKAVSRFCFKYGESEGIISNLSS